MGASIQPPSLGLNLSDIKAIETASIFRPQLIAPRQGQLRVATASPRVVWKERAATDTKNENK